MSLMSRMDLMRNVSVKTIGMGKPLVPILEPMASISKPLLPVLDSPIARSMKATGINIEPELKRDKDLIKPLAKMAGLFINFCNSVSNAQKQKRKVAWINLPTPVEILYALGIIPFPTEAFAVIKSALGVATDGFERAESHGISSVLSTFKCRIESR